MKSIHKKILAALVLAITLAFSVSYILLLLGYLGLRQENADLTSRNEQLSSLQVELDTVRAENIQNEEAITNLESEKAALESEREEMAAKAEADQAALQEAQKQLSAKQVFTLKAGSILDGDAPADPDLDTFFTAYPIEEGDAVYQRIAGKSFPTEGDVQIKLEDLRYLKLLHYNFAHQVQAGELIVNASIADKILTIFKELYRNEYEIERMVLIDEYWQGDAAGTDSVSIDHNNTSCFNYRVVEGSGELSGHAFGLAIDINPIQNPFISSSGTIYHAESEAYRNRDIDDPHVIKHADNDLCYTLFTQNGFEWGGDKTAPIDYQHFEYVEE